MAHAPVRITVIAEAESDCRHICGIIDRKILKHAPDWLDEQQLSYERVYTGILEETSFTRWAELKRMRLQSAALRAGGYIGFRAGGRHYDHATVRKAIGLCVSMPVTPDVVVLIRDMDDQRSEREDSIRDAVGGVTSTRFQIVVGLPIAKREAWVLNGFVPKTATERRMLGRLRAELGFDPCVKAHRLTAVAHSAKLNAKRVLRALTAGDRDREVDCWRSAEWTLLRERGKTTGLSDFLASLNRAVVPLFSRLR